MKRAVNILWPSFLVAGVFEVVFFTLVDPEDFELARLAPYSVGFFCFWSIAAASSALTCFFVDYRR